MGTSGLGSAKLDAITGSHKPKQVMASSLLASCRSSSRANGRRVQKSQQLLADRVGIAVDVAEAGPDTANPTFVTALAAINAGDAATAADRATRLPTTWPGRTLIEGLVSEHRGDLVDATRQLQLALQQATPASELWLEVAAALCRVAFNAGNIALAIEVGESALKVVALPSARSEDLSVGIRATLSGVYVDAGNLVRARELAEDPAVKPVTAWQRGTQLWARSILAAVNGELDQADLLASEALQMFREADRPISVARLQVNAAMLKLQVPGADTAPSLQLLISAERAFRGMNAPFDLAGCLTARARLDALSGDASAARSAMEEALLLVRDEGVGMRARIYASAGMTFLLLKDRRSADAHLLEARHLLEGAGANRAAAATWRQLASAYEDMEQLDLALACMKAATDLLGVHVQPNAPAHAIA